MSFRIINSDCLDAMRAMQESSVDAIVTDPPYGLSFMGKEWDSFGQDVRQPKDGEVFHGSNTPYGRGKVRYGVGNSYGGNSENAMVAFQTNMTPIFAEALRVAKPGAYLLAFGGTRTYHRLACAIEDAGWEVRDCIMWVYGSGFPKSMDVSKAIAKRAGGDLEAKNAIEFMRARREELGLSRIEFEKRIFGRSDGNVRNWEDGISIPIPGLWTSIKKAMELDETPFDSVMERGDREVSRETGSFGYQKDRERWKSEHVEREAVTDMAKEWSGWGTCLKPAWEPIIVARKPLEGTVAANVLKYGTGAINIDACRVPTEDNLNGGAHSANSTRSSLNGDTRSAAGMGMFAPGKVCPEPFVQPSGRWPANLIHDGSEEVMECFPDNVKGWTWNRTDGARPFNNEGKPTNYKSAGSDKSVGSAARFFYCAKASKADRGEGNDHPTVKPIALMKYLVKLVCRRGGTVLDPFCGSGTTGVAAVELGNSFIGIERDEHYFSIAKSRVEKAAEKIDETAEL